MHKTVTAALPANLTNEDRHLFEPFATYPIEDLKILRLHEIFVSYSGLCLNENGLIPESHHSYPEKYQALVSEAAYYFDRALKDKAELIELDDDRTYLLIHHPWSSNYWHWMTEAILRVWMVRAATKDMILVLPEHFKTLKFVEDSLSSFHFRGVLYIPFGKSLLIRNLCLPQIKPVADSYYANEVHAIREFYLEHIVQRDAANKPNERVYISRKKSSKRRVQNEEKVEELMAKYGFRCVNNEDLNFQEQITLFAEVQYLISIHGAGMTNMIFMRNNSSVLELHKKKTNDKDWHSFAFWYLADVLNFQYYHQVCEPVDPDAGFFEADFIVDISHLERNISLMLDESIPTPNLHL